MLEGRAIFIVGVIGGAAVLITATACQYPSVDDLEGDNSVLLPGRTSSSEAGADGATTKSATRDAGGANPNNPGPGPNPGTLDASPPPGPKVDAAPPAPTPVGKWLQANEQECGLFCASRSMTNVASPEGARCTSGENIPQSALTAGINYDECFPNCGSAHMGTNPKSIGKNCYADGQKQDNDDSDVTRGCFCK